MPAPAVWIGQRRDTGQWHVIVVNKRLRRLKIGEIREIEEIMAVQSL
jgi:hypothetical protein